jgi:hypothetical protein
MSRLGPAELEDERERRRSYRHRLVVRHPNGGEAGVDPRDLPRDLLAEAHRPAPLLDAIREKCLDCSGYQPAEIARCTAVACSLWPYRMGTNPFSNRKGNAGAFQKGLSSPATPVQAGDFEPNDPASTQDTSEARAALGSPHGRSGPEENGHSSPDDRPPAPPARQEGCP